MKLWTKLLVVLLTLTMVLSLAACGNKDPEETPAGTKPGTTPAETTPAETPDESTPDESTPEASQPDESTPAATPDESTPAETPNESTPAASQPDETPAESTPAETIDPDRPTEPTMEDEYMDGDAENWLFKIDQSTETFVMDGVLEKAYYDGIYLVGDISKPASNSNFDVFMTADAENIYVFYEFTKEEGIFWDANYATKYHLDCVDFCLNLAGKRAKGTEFHIYAGVEGDETTAVADTATLKTLGITDFYVKHTDKGYNVEFAIPLEGVVGMYENGDKMISFTALSTITTSWDKSEDPAAAPKRVYTVACKGAGAEAKDDPTYLVINGTKTENPPEMTDDGRYAFTLNAAAESLEDDTARAAAYAEGLTFVRKFQEGPAELVNDKNDFQVTLLADAENIYVLFEIKDSNIRNDTQMKAVNAGATDESQWWWNDCAEIYWYNSSNTPTLAAAGTGIPDKDIRVWGITEGTNHYTTAGAANNDMINAINGGWLKEYTVKHVKEGETTVGYTVEYVISREEATTDNMFGFLACVTHSDVTKAGADGAIDTYGRAYSMITNSGGASGNSSKKWANVITIVDPAAAE